MSCRWKRRQKRLDQVLRWGILKWPSVGDFGWPPGTFTSSLLLHAMLFDSEVVNHTMPMVGVNDVAF
jgi:hypothetical protein